MGERTGMAGSEVCPDQQRQVHCLWQKPEAQACVAWAMPVLINQAAVVFCFVAG